jgi:hypothetical protein
LDPEPPSQWTTSIRMDRSPSFSLFSPLTYLVCPFIAKCIYHWLIVVTPLTLLRELLNPTHDPNCPHVVIESTPQQHKELQTQKKTSSRHCHLLIPQKELFLIVALMALSSVCLPLTAPLVAPLHLPPSSITPPPLTRQHCTLKDHIKQATIHQSPNHQWQQLLPQRGGGGPTICTSSTSDSSAPLSNTSTPVSSDNTHHRRHLQASSITPLTNLDN